MNPLQPGPIVKWMDQRLYPDQTEFWDDLLLRRAVLNHLHPRAIVLDLGAGSGIVKEMNFRGQAAAVHGLDPDERVLENPYLDEARQGTGEQIPYEDSTFDVVFADNVLEHLAEPDRVFREVTRVLRPGGHFLIKTPNRRHYMPLIARLTPHRFHAFYNRLRGRHEVDTFRTLYRANNRRALIALSDAAGLSVVDVSLHEGRPEYLRLTFVTYLFGWIYERLVNRFTFLADFRILVIAVVRKPD